MKEKEILSLIEILKILERATNDKKSLSKEGILLSHYLLKNYKLNKTEVNTLERYHRARIFDLCDYEEIFKVSITKKLVNFKYSKNGFSFKISAEGKELLKKFDNHYTKEIDAKLKNISFSSFDIRALRLSALPMVNIQ